MNATRMKQRVAFEIEVDFTSFSCYISSNDRIELLSAFILFYSIILLYHV
jgi:hypothetical protein